MDQSSETAPYLAPEADRVPFERIDEGTRVRVPVWKTGRVTGWTNGTVFKINTPLHAGINDVFFLVRHDVTDVEMGYYHWSMARPVEPVEPSTYKVDLCQNCYIVAANDDWSGVAETAPRPLRLIPRGDRVVVTSDVEFVSNEDCEGCGALPGNRLVATVFEADKNR